MGWREREERNRIRMLKELKREYGGARPPEVLEAERLISKYRKRQTAVLRYILRAEIGLPEPDLCPECWYDDGRRNLLELSVHNSSRGFDEWQCPECGLVQQREVGSKTGEQKPRATDQRPQGASLSR